MAVQSIACSSCGAGVPYGRLSCPSCGDLLASVVGGRRSTAAVRAVPDVDEMLPSGEVPPTVEATPDVEAVPDALAGPNEAAAPAPAAWSAAAPPPGAYIPPRLTPVASPVPPVVAAAVPMPAGPPAPARAWASRPAEPDVHTTEASATPDTARLTEAAGWLVIAGTALAGVGFLLPWSVVAIGAQGTDYFARWGLASPGHLLVALSVVAILVINLLDQVTSRIPLWARAGIPGLGVGALLLGLVWPYVVGPLGADPGAVVVTVGALVLVAGGIVAIAADRHAGVA